jgi:MFS family permease
MPPLYTRPFWLAFCIHLTGSISLAMVMLLPLLVRHVGGSELTIGLVLGGGAAASVAARPVVGRLLDRIGRRRVLLACGALNAVSWLPFILVDRVGPLLFAAAIFHAVVWGALFAAYFTYAADLIPASRRAEGIAVFGVAGMAGNGIGPVLGEIVIDEAGYAAYCLVAAAFALVSLVLTLGVRRDDPRDDPQDDRMIAAGTRGPAPGMLAVASERGLARVLGASFLLGIAINAAFFFVAPFTRDLGMARAGLFFGTYSLATVGVRVLGRRTLDTLGAHAVSIPGFVLYAVGLTALVLLPAPGVLVASGICCGLAHGALFPVLNALTITRASVESRGTAISLMTAVIDLGGVVGTPLCGAIAQVAGYRLMFVTMAVASLGGVGVMATDPLGPRRRARPAPLAPPGRAG